MAYDESFTDRYCVTSLIDGGTFPGKPFENAGDSSIVELTHERIKSEGIIMIPQMQFPTPTAQ